METKIAKTVGNLIQGTQARTFNWEVTTKKNAYRLKLLGGAIEVERWAATDEQTGAMHDMVDITFLQQSGEEVDRYMFSDIDEPNDYAELRKLHDAARRNALRTDEKLAGLFGEIDEKLKKAREKSQ